MAQKTKTAIILNPGRRVALAAAACLLLSGAPATAGERPPLRTDELTSGVSAVVRADGALELRRPSPVPDPLFTAELTIPQAGRAGRGARGASAYHLGRSAEGGAGGLRGFSAAADDDDDGLLDEDRLDGIDNDGDGLVDEDYAAVSEAMIAVTRGSGVSASHVEHYRWNQARLRGAVFMAADGPAGSRWDMTTGGSPWQDVAVPVAVHSATGRAATRGVAAFVSQIVPGAACGSPGGGWLGVAVLDEPAPDRSGRVRVDGADLSVALGPRPVAVVVCAAESWQQLLRLLAEAGRLREGVTDPVTGARAPWIAAPACQPCRTATVPDFRWRLADGGDLVLLADVAAGGALPDPDLLAIGGTRLGAPTRVSWSPASGAETGVAWSCVEAEFLARGLPRREDLRVLLGEAAAHGAAGRIELVYVAPAADVLGLLQRGGGPRTPLRLDLVTVDGRRLEADLAADLDGLDPVRSAIAMARSAEEPAVSAARQSQLLRNGRARVQLSPELLQGWPNPFRETISVRFRVPSSVGEAFTWGEDEEAPAGLDLAAPVPWQKGAPHATVKIYTMSGQEVATLHDAEVVGGEVTVSWSGSDDFGRKVASGTYFCKLQMDEWSVTRRLVYLR